MSILIVAEADDAAQLLTRMLREGGHEDLCLVSSLGELRAALQRRAEDGRSAWEAVILDMASPDLGAFEACRAIRDDLLGRHLPLVALAEAGQPAALEAMLQAGLTDFVRKPVGRTELLVRVQTVIRLATAQGTVRAYERVLTHYGEDLAPTHEAIAQLRVQDPLTMLANRPGFEAFLDRSWRLAARSRQPLSLLLLDVDHFAGYNATFGRQGGDAALKAIAQALSRHARRPLDMVARLDADRFAVLLGDTPLENALLVARFMQEAIAALELQHPGSSTGRTLTASFGAACLVPDAEHRAADLVAQATAARLSAKEAGRNAIASQAAARGA